MRLQLINIINIIHYWPEKDAYVDARGTRLIYLTPYTTYGGMIQVNVETLAIAEAALLLPAAEMMLHVAV